MLLVVLKPKPMGAGSRLFFLMAESSARYQLPFHFFRWEVPFYSEVRIPLHTKLLANQGFSLDFTNLLLF